MFYFNFSIRNPFYKTIEGEERILYFKDIKLSTNKFFECDCQTFTSSIDLFSIKMDLNWWGEDHAGPRFELKIYKFYLSIKIYDNRHWDDDHNDWEK